MVEAFFAWSLDHLAGILRELSLDQNSFGVLLLGGAPLFGVCGNLIHAESQCLRWNLVNGLISSWSACIGLVYMLGCKGRHIMIGLIDVLENI